MEDKYFIYMYIAKYGTLGMYYRVYKSTIYMFFMFLYLNTMLNVRVYSQNNLFLKKGTVQCKCFIFSSFSTDIQTIFGFLKTDIKLKTLSSNP